MYGWAFQLHGCVFVAKDMQWDATHLPAALAGARAQGDDVTWVVIFPEGTRFDATDAAGQSVERSRLFALERHLPDMTAVLMPRTRVRARAVSC